MNNGSILYPAGVTIPWDVIELTILIEVEEKHLLVINDVPRDLVGNYHNMVYWHPKKVRTPQYRTV